MRTCCNIALISCATLLVMLVFLRHKAHAQEDMAVPDSIAALVAGMPAAQRDSAYVAIGRQYYATEDGNKIKIAFACYNEAMGYAQRYNHPEYITRCYFHLASVYDAFHSPQAIPYYTLYHNALAAAHPTGLEMEFAAYTLATLYSRITAADSTMKYVLEMKRYADTVSRTLRDKAGNYYWQRVYLEMALAMLNLRNDKAMKQYYEMLPAAAVFYRDDLRYERMYAAVKSRYMMRYDPGQDFTAPLLELLNHNTGAGADSLEVFRSVVEVLLLNGQYKEACQYWKQIDNMMDIRGTAVYHDLQYKLLTTEKEQAQKTSLLLKEEQKRLQQRDMALIALCIAMAGGMLAAGLAYRKIRGQNTVLNEQNDKIKVQSDNIESLIREVHHRVKNNLQIVSSMIDLQQVKETGTNVLWLREIQSKMRTIALAHQMIYEQENMSVVSLQAYFSQMTNDILNTLLTSSNTVTGRINMEDLRMGLDKLVPFAIIVNELIVNTVKHVVPVKPDCAITLTGREDNSRIIISYADNGPGMPPGIDPQKSRSLGLRLIKKLAAQVGATVGIDSRPGERLEFTFVLG